MHLFYKKSQDSILEKRNGHQNNDERTSQDGDSFQIPFNSGVIGVEFIAGDDISSSLTFVAVRDLAFIFLAHDIAYS